MPEIHGRKATSLTSFLYLYLIDDADDRKGIDIGKLIKLPRRIAYWQTIYDNLK